MGTQPPDIDIMGRYWNTMAGAGDGMTQKGILEILQQAIELIRYRLVPGILGNDGYMRYIYIHSYINNYIYIYRIDIYR